MNEPIKSGDECIVIGGALGGRSSNKGRRVIVVHQRGELIINPIKGSEGVVWRCRSQDGKPFVRHDPSLFPDVPPDHADFLASWLQKADPLPPKVTSTTDELENA